MVNLKEKLLAGWVGKAILKQGRVTSVVALGARYRCFTIEVAGSFEAGDKVQVFMKGVGTRTYTPFGKASGRGGFQLLSHLRREGPASAWANAVKVGDALRFVGPQGSLALASMTSPVALLGDETSLAVARALLGVHGQSATAVLEVADVESARAACLHIGLPESTLVQRAANDSFYGALAQRLVDHAGARGTIVFTGSAQTAQRVRAALRLLDVRPVTKAKAYWSVGKVGLD